MLMLYHLTNYCTLIRTNTIECVILMLGLWQRQWDCNSSAGTYVDVAVFPLCIAGVTSCIALPGGARVDAPSFYPILYRHENKYKESGLLLATCDRRDALPWKLYLASSVITR